MRVHKSGRPFTDPSGDRLRGWMGLTEAQFYDRDRVAIVPMAFCFPGYSAKKADLPPPAVCAKTWHAEVMKALPNIELTLLVGKYAQDQYLGHGTRQSLSDRVAGWRDHAPHVFPLPHPSWRNNAWIRKHPWFLADVIPALRNRVADILG